MSSALNKPPPTIKPVQLKNAERLILTYFHCKINTGLGKILAISQTASAGYHPAGKKQLQSVWQRKPDDDCKNIIP
jgi:hypothetical protein